MEQQSLTPATQAVLKALAELGQGNVHELAEKSGKARSTTDKAIRTLSEAGLIVEVDLGTDPAEGTPTRWTLSEDTAAALDAAALDAAGLDETGDEPDPGPADEPDAGNSEPVIDDDNQPEVAGHHDDPVTDGRATSDKDTADGADRTDDDADGTGAPAEAGSPPTVTAAPRPGDRKVMAIKGVLADHQEDGATVEVIVTESGISHPTTVRLLAAMEQADAARRKPGAPERWIAGPTKASEVDPNPEPPRCALCMQVIRNVTTTPAVIAAVQSLTRADRTLHVVGPDDDIHVVALPTRLPPRSVNTTPTRLGARTDATINADGNQPFARGELEKLTVAVLAANPGRPMTPQEIATTISTQLGGRNVSSGAVRNNCTKAAAAGNIQLHTEAPLTFLLPIADDDSTEEQPTDGEQPGADTADGATGEADTSAQADNDTGDASRS